MRFFYLNVNKQNRMSEIKINEIFHISKISEIENSKENTLKGF